MTSCSGRLLTISARKASAPMRQLLPSPCTSARQGVFASPSTSSEPSMDSRPTMPTSSDG
ncbi:hypothetical protein Y695_03595 [Hydrogenophaga sp. T4]|nr:hypothetical protein Y695_03595 [Hydrogenophaga sp. T4]